METFISHFEQKLFPRFSEMQYFILITAVVLMFIFSPNVKTETVLFIRNIHFESLTIGLIFVWAVQIFVLIILPVILAISMIGGKKFDNNMKQVLCIFYYSLYGIFGLFSVNDQYRQYTGETATFEKLNVLMTLIIFSVLIFRWIVMIMLLKFKNPKIDSYFAARFKDIQYHWFDFFIILVSSIVIMGLLRNYYTNPASLVFLTISYSLFVLKIFDLIFHKINIPILK